MSAPTDAVQLALALQGPLALTDLSHSWQPLTQRQGNRVSALTGGKQPGADETEASLTAAPPVVPPGHRSPAELGARLLFEKVMTTCDVSGHGRIVIPKVRLVSAVAQSARRTVLVWPCSM